MFFPELITGLRSTDRVLEIGPGANPHPRSDVLLELAFSDEAEYENQVGHSRKLQTTKQVVYYDGHEFPFADKTFDYVICIQVIEHVVNLEQFLAEVFRVGKRGYFEYPLAYYDYLYNIKAHVNFIKHEQGTLRYMRKAASALADFKPLHALFLQTLVNGHTELIDDMPGMFMEGIQWEAPLRCAEVHRLAEVCHRDYPVSKHGARRLENQGIQLLARALGKALLIRAGLTPRPAGRPGAVQS